jgi:hypothetical protein
MSSENLSGAVNQQERPTCPAALSFNNELSHDRCAGILRGHTQGSLGSRGMKIWSMPPGDLGKDMNYNGPKVAKFLVG